MTDHHRKHVFSRRCLNEQRKADVCSWSQSQKCVEIKALCNVPIKHFVMLTW